MKLSSTENLMYDRQLKLQNVGEKGQLKLKNSKVLVIGAGGLGCPALIYLTAAGVGTIGIMDFDLVEISNLQRQILFTTNDIGKPKAICASQLLKEKNSLIQINCYIEKLTVKNAIEIFKMYDIIIDGTDNFESRYLINDACVLSQKILIYGSVEKFEGHVSVFNYPLTDEKRSATYRCLFPKPPESLHINCSDVGVLGVLPGIVGSIQATEAIKIILNIGENLAGKLLMIDALSMQFSKLNIERNELGWKNFPQTVEQFEEMDYPAFCKLKNSLSNMNCISAEELFAMIFENQKFQLIDVRQPLEQPEFDFYKNLNIPIESILDRKNEIRSDIPVVFFCSSGERSSQALQRLKEHYQMENLFQLEGGVAEWIKMSTTIKL